jgi:hypothetical protein
MNPLPSNAILHATAALSSRPSLASGHWRGPGLSAVLAVHLRRTNRPGVVPGLISEDDTLWSRQGRPDGQSRHSIPSLCLQEIP